SHLLTTAVLAQLPAVGLGRVPGAQVDVVQAGDGEGRLAVASQDGHDGEAQGEAGEADLVEADAVEVVGAAGAGAADGVGAEQGDDQLRPPQAVGALVLPAGP